MNLTHIKILNTLGARRVSLAIHTAITLICGRNGAAKSSINESVRMAFSGAGLRVTEKKSYPLLVSEGARTGAIDITTDEGMARLALPSGAHKVDGALARGLPDALPYVLDAQGFAQLTPEARRTFLFALTNCEATPAEVKRRLLDKGANEAKVDQVLPMIRAGFPAASDFAKTEASKAKGAWQTTTGEKFGTKKGLSWEAEAPTVDTAAADAAVADQRNAQAAADAAQAALDAARTGVVHHMALFLHQHRRLLNSFELLDDTGPDQLLRIYEQEHGKLDAAAAPLTEDELYLLRDERDKAGHALHLAREAATRHLNAAEKALAADDVTARAAGHFNDAAEWIAITDALAPDGIPAEMLAQALKPINLALRKASLKTGWRQPAIGADMTITAEGRVYELHSVSEKWRIDAMIAAAIAELSGVKVLLLDGFDVLDLADRDQLLLWLDELARDGAINTALINATLKAAPAGLPDTITALWIEQGELIHEPTKGAAA